MYALEDSVCDRAYRARTCDNVECPILHNHAGLLLFEPDRTARPDQVGFVLDLGLHRLVHLGGHPLSVRAYTVVSINFSSYETHRVTAYVLQLLLTGTSKY